MQLIDQPGYHLYQSSHPPTSASTQNPLFRLTLSQKPPTSINLHHQREPSSGCCLLRLGQLKQDNRLTKVCPVHAVWHDVCPLIADHELTPLGAERPEVNVGAILDVDHALLTTLRAQARLRVPVLEEIIQAAAVHEDTGRIEQS